MKLIFIILVFFQKWWIKNLNYFIFVYLNTLLSTNNGVAQQIWISFRKSEWIDSVEEQVDEFLTSKLHPRKLLNFDIRLADRYKGFTCFQTILFVAHITLEVHRNANSGLKQNFTIVLRVDNDELQKKLPRLG